MISSALTSPVTITSPGAVTVNSLTPSTDAGSSVLLSAHGSFENLDDLQVTWGNGEDIVNYDNVAVGDSSTTWEIRGTANSYGDGNWGLTLTLVFSLNETLVDVYNGVVTDLPLEFTVNPTFEGSGNFVVLDCTIVQVV